MDLRQGYPPYMVVSESEDPEGRKEFKAETPSLPTEECVYLCAYSSTPEGAAKQLIRGMVALGYIAEGHEVKEEGTDLL